MNTRVVATYLERLRVFVLLLVYYPETEVNFVGLVEIGVHTHHLAERFLCMFETAVPVVEDPDAVPELWLLRVLQMV